MSSTKTIVSDVSGHFLGLLTDRLHQQDHSSFWHARISDDSCMIPRSL